MSDVNALWMSQMRACPCNIDALSGGCGNNALVDPRSPGYIFYDRDFVSRLAMNSGNSALAGAWLLSHEAGHNVQIRLGMQFALGVRRELSADCLGGYFLASVVCSGKALDSEITNAVMAACTIGDPAGYPWFLPGAHGSCADRISAVTYGIAAYRNGTSPVVACGQ